MVKGGVVGQKWSGQGGGLVGGKRSEISLETKWEGSGMDDRVG